MHSLNKYNPSVLISPENSGVVKRLLAIGVNVIPTKPIDELIPYERYHADMQLLIIKHTAFVAGNSDYLFDVLNKLNYNIIPCEKLCTKYPNNILLNAALVGDKLMCKSSALSYQVKRFCVSNDIEIIDVKQGYTKCSTLVLKENAIITADKNIYNKALCNGIDALLISAGSIELKGADYGFIGGCSGVVGDTVVFFGNIHTHPDCKNITKFIDEHGLLWMSLQDGPLVDVGGLVNL